MNLNDLNFIIKEEVINGIFYCEIFTHNNLKLNLQYAYYLFKNDVRIRIQWYSSSNRVEFKLDENGIYHVACFVKQDENKIIKLSKKVQYMPEYKYVQNGEIIKKAYEISIFGSCVSRDLLDYAGDIFDLKTYVARQSIVSALSKPIECNINDIKLESKFQRNQVYGDLVKNTFEKLSIDGSKYLLIDLIDERFKLISYKDTILTLSSELQKSNYIKNYKEISRKKNIEMLNKLSDRCNFHVNNTDLAHFIDEFCLKILNIYNSNNIIIHKAKMLDYYMDKSGKIIQFSKSYLNNNKEINEVLEYMYDYLIKKLPNSYVIDICDDFVADENNKWGLAPMHYQEEYYLKALDNLKKYIRK